MPLLLLTIDNLAFIKTRVRYTSPHLKSGHVTEALASACGFRTHASMLAAIGGASKVHPVLQEFMPERFYERLLAMGIDHQFRFPFDEFIRSDELPQRIWTRVKGRHLPTVDRWYYECQDRNIPYVYIELRRKYCELHWDCYSLDTANEAHVRGVLGSDLTKTMYAEFQSIMRDKPNKAMFEASSFSGSIDKLLPEDAQHLADVMFELLYRPLLSRQNAA